MKKLDLVLFIIVFLLIGNIGFMYYHIKHGSYDYASLNASSVIILCVALFNCKNLV